MTLFVCKPVNLFLTDYQKMVESFAGEAALLYGEEFFSAPLKRAEPVIPCIPHVAEPDQIRLLPFTLERFQAWEAYHWYLLQKPCEGFPLCHMKRPILNSHPDVTKEWVDVQQHMLALRRYYQTASEWFWHFQYTHRVATSEGFCLIALPNVIPMHNKYRPLQDYEERLTMVEQHMEEAWSKLQGRSVFSLERDYSAGTYFQWIPNVLMPESGTRGSMVINGAICQRCCTYVAIVLKQ